MREKQSKEIFKQTQLDHKKSKNIWKELKGNSNANKSSEHSSGSCTDVALGKDLSLLQVPS